jgi:hypothetical protein
MLGPHARPCVPFSHHRCPGGGSLTGTVDDADNSLSQTDGDSVSADFHDCLAFFGTIARADGRLSMTLSEATGDVEDGVAPFTLGLTAQFDRLDAEGATFSGRSETLARYVFSSSLFLADSHFSESQSGHYSDTDLDGSVTFTTPTPFTGVGAGDATAGELLVRGAGRSSVRLIAWADGEGVQLEVDDTGDGVVDQTIETTRARLEAGE